MVGTRFGSPTATIWATSTPGEQVAGTPPATSVTPASAVYGPGAVNVSDGLGVFGGTAGHLATYIGIGALVALVLIRWSLPKGRRGEVGASAKVDF
jgi:hypothetical protein